MTVHAKPSAQLLDVLSARLGEPHVITDPGQMAGYLVESRNLYRGTALAVVRPGSTGEVAFTVGECAKAGVAIVPQGGNTGLVRRVACPSAASCSRSPVSTASVRSIPSMPP